MHVCTVACYKCLVFNTPFHCILLINFMNEGYRSNLKLNSHLNGKNHQPIFYDLVCGWKSFQKAKCTHPLLFVKLNQIIYIYMYAVTIKKNM
jgi:hypothetical protein